MANNVIGRVVATEKRPTTIDEFTFWTDSNLILNPFDIVKVQHVNGSFSYGVIEDIAHITDAASFLTDFISSDFGDVDVEFIPTNSELKVIKDTVQIAVGKKTLEFKNVVTTFDYDGEEHLMLLQFDQLYGGGSTGVYGQKEHAGVNVVYNNK